MDIYFLLTVSVQGWLAALLQVVIWGNRSLESWWLVILQQNIWENYACGWFFPDSSVGTEAARNAGDSSSISGSGRSTGEGIGYPLQYSGLENSMDCIPWTSRCSRKGYRKIIKKAEEPEIKLPKSTGSLKKQERSRKTSTSALCQSLWLCGSQQIVETS